LQAKIRFGSQNPSDFGWIRSESWILDFSRIYFGKILENPDAIFQDFGIFGSGKVGLLGNK